MGNSPYFFRVPILMLVGALKIHNKDEYIFQQYNQLIINKVSAPVASTRDAFAERLQSTW